MVPDEIKQFRNKEQKASRYLLQACEDLAHLRSNYGKDVYINEPEINRYQGIEARMKPTNKIEAELLNIRLAQINDKKDVAEQSAKLKEASKNGKDPETAIEKFNDELGAKMKEI